MSSAYTIDLVDLSSPKEKTPIVSTLASPVVGVYIISAPGPATLHFGQGGQPWPVVQGKYYKFCPPETDGIFVTNTVAAGFLSVAVTYEKGSVEVIGQDETPQAAVKAVYARSNQGGSVNSGPVVQLHNPANSGRNLIVNRIAAASGTAGFCALTMMRRVLSNNGGGVLTLGAARFLDRRLAPANPIVLVRDAGILGTIAGSTFDNLFYTELGGAATVPITEALQTVAFAGAANVLDFLRDNEPITLSPGWGVQVQHFTNGVGVLMSAFFVASPG